MPEPVNSFPELRLRSALKDLVKNCKRQREDSIAEAMTWPKGPSQEEREFKKLYESGGYVIGVEKPGKEAAPKRKKPKPHDMLPTVRLGGQNIGYIPSFAEIFFRLWSIEKTPEATESQDLLACLLFRAAHMLDHDNPDGCYRYHPPASVLQAIESGLPVIPTGDDTALPTSAFLYVLELIALNEDVKYSEDGKVKGRKGRCNTLLTFCHAIACHLGRVPLSKFAAGLIWGRGVSPIPPEAAMSAFPRLQDR